MQFSKTWSYNCPSIKTTTFQNDYM